MQDLNCVFDLNYGSMKCCILNPLSEARDWTHILMDTSQVRYCWATTGTPLMHLSCFYFLHAHPLNWIPEWLTRSWRSPMMDCRWRKMKALWRTAIPQRGLVAQGAMGQQEIYSLAVAATIGRWSWVPPHGKYTPLFFSLSCCQCLGQFSSIAQT